MSELYAWRGRAGLVQVGHLLQGKKKTPRDVWEILEMRHDRPQPAPTRTLWWRAVNPFTGEEATLPPRPLTALVTFLLTAEELDAANATRRPPDRQGALPADAPEILLLAEQLGASALATLDKATGRVICPRYGGDEPSGVFTEHGVYASLIEHLEIAHGMDTTGLLDIPDPDARIAAIHAAHGRAHDRSQPQIGKGGFPHYHEGF